MKLRITLTLPYDPTPGEGGYLGCETVDDCFALDEGIFDADVVGFIEALAAVSFDRDDEIDASLVLINDASQVVA